MNPQFSPESRGIPVESISWRDERERPLDDRIVQQIYESINEHGLIAPVGVVSTGAGGYYLVYGAHRLAAWKRRHAEARDDDSRWFLIPCLLYPDSMTEDNAKLLELRENLERSELTKEQRDHHIAKVLELHKSKSAQCTFRPPCQGDVIKDLGMSPRGFKKRFKQYQEAAGLDVNWTKLTEAQYDHFTAWNRDSDSVAPVARDCMSEVCNEQYHKAMGAMDEHYEWLEATGEKEGRLYDEKSHKVVEANKAYIDSLSPEWQSVMLKGMLQRLKVEDKEWFDKVLIRSLERRAVTVRPGISILGTIEGLGKKARGVSSD